MIISRKKKIVVASIALLLILSVAKESLVTRRKRRWAVRPLNRLRRQFGQFENLVQFIKAKDHEQFFKYTRLTPELFEKLLKIVGKDLQKHPQRKALSPEQRLIMTLHFLSQGSSMQEIAWMFFVGKSTVHYVIKETCDVLWKLLRPTYLPFPTEEGFRKISSGFFKRWNMPNCVGALDGKHVVIQAPKNSGTEFFSYKKSFSLVLMATCDAFYKFNMVDIGAAGANHDGYIFSNSGFGRNFLNGAVSIPPPQKLPQTETVVPHFLIADQAFPLHSNIMRPFPGERLGEEKTIFNYRLSRARRCIENTFGILVQRWRVLRKPIIANIETCEQIVKATVVLHNFIQKSEEDIPEGERRYSPTGNADYIDRNGTLHLGRWRDEPGNSIRSVRRVGSNNSTRRAQSNRDLLAEYFVSEAGTVPWQWDKILEGSLPTYLV